MKANRDIIIRPLLTEKMTTLQDVENKVAFAVDKNATKIEISKAVEERFNVKVKKVATMNVKGKVKRMGRFQGAKPNWKKAIITLFEGFKIDFFEGK